MDEQIWVYSRLIDPEEVVQTGCLTTLPVRVHGRNDIAENATRRLTAEWAQIMGEEETGVSHARLWSEYGDYSSFFYPESRPERLGLMAYLTELAFIHDGMLAYIPNVMTMFRASARWRIR
jgi:ophiobolin F synthase